MQDSWYSFDVSPIWIIAAAIAAAGITYFLYSRKGMPWSRSTNLMLGLLRFIAIFLILLLIINPVFIRNVNNYEQPIVVIAVDNSESVTARNSAPSPSDIQAQISQLKDDLSQNYSVPIQTLDFAQRDTIQFAFKTTDLSEFLKKIESAYDGQNLKAIVLYSDGIITKGISPAYKNFKTPIYTIGLGDTISPKDIVIQNIRNNEIAFEGNSFPVEVTVGQIGYKGAVEVKITEGDKIIATKSVELTSKNNNVAFLLEARSSGLKRYTAQVSRRDGESSSSNNFRDFYVNVIEGKEKVLILAPAPHPDLRAIRDALTLNANYETTLYIPGINSAPADKKFDVIIEHQAYSTVQYGSYSSTGKWNILGHHSNIGKMKQECDFLKIEVKNANQDKVKPAYNKAFSKFKLNSELITRMEGYPPVYVPFGEYNVSGPAESLFFQQIGRVETDRPMFLFFDNGTEKSAITTGDGIWQWKMQEAGREGDPRLFNEIVQKTVQYLSLKTNKDRFIVKPRENTYHIGQRVFLDIEVYNEIFEPSYENQVKLTLTDEEGNMTYEEIVNHKESGSFNLGLLSKGMYRYTASTVLGGQTYTENGSFLIRDIQIEKINLTADHTLLYKIASNSGGGFYYFSQGDQLAQKLIDENFPQLIRTKTEKTPLIDFSWIMWLIVGLLGVEWFFRKYLGSI